MISALVPGASGPGSSPGRGHCVVFLGKRHLTLTVPLSTHEHKWVPANCWGKPNKLWGNDLRWTSILSRGSRNTPSLLYATETGDKLRQLWSSRIQGFIFLYCMLACMCTRKFPELQSAMLTTVKLGVKGSHRDFATSVFVQIKTKLWLNIFPNTGNVLNAFRTPS